MDIKTSAVRFVLRRRSLLAAVLGAAIVVLGVWTFVRPPQPDRATYQAVFLANGQVYFGKLSLRWGSYARLDEVHYLVANPQTNDASEADRARKSQLVRLGSEVHRPEPFMYIANKQILFWEDLVEDSPIVEAMQKAATE